MVHERPEFKKFMEKNLPNSEFHLDLEIIANPPKEYIKDFFAQLKKHKQYDKLKDDFIYDSELNIFAQIHNRFPFSDIEDLSTEEVFFYPFMEKKDIKRIFTIKSSEDFLLRLRAEQIERNVRLKRTFSKLKKKFGQDYSFLNHFETHQYKNYLKNLKPEYKEKCLNIPHGTIHSKEANGMCLNTPFGNIIVLSYGLRHFLFYMNVFYFGRQLGMEFHERLEAFVLAIRIMIGTESFDFELDPRAKFPKSIKKKIDVRTDWQMLFIVGHEYAHHYLGHVGKSKTINLHRKVEFITAPSSFYNYSQVSEFEADKNSILNTVYHDDEQAELINGAFLFFIYLDLYEKVEDYLFPKRNQIQTHPQPLERLWKLRSEIADKIGLDPDDLKTIIADNSDFINGFLEEFLPYNVEAIETIGSVYITKYRKKILIDRLDF